MARWILNRFLLIWIGTTNFSIPNYAKPSHSKKASNLVHIGRSYIEDHPTVVQVVQRVLERIERGEYELAEGSQVHWQCPNQGPQVCGVPLHTTSAPSQQPETAGTTEPGRVPSAEYKQTTVADIEIQEDISGLDDTHIGFGEESSLGLADKWLDIVNKLDQEGCETCLSVWTVLKNFVCAGLSWEVLRDVLIISCEEALAEAGDDPVMCNGTITLQGKHLYCILQEADIKDFCDSLGSCYPPDFRERPPVRLRTPWWLLGETELESDDGPHAWAESGPHAWAESGPHAWAESGPHARAESGPHARAESGPHARAERLSTEGLVKVVQLNDIHIQYKYTVGSPSECSAFVCCQEDSIGSGSARQYGEYQCNIPPRTLDLFLKRVRQADPDFVLYAGDSPPHTMWDETLTSQMNCSRLVVDAMKNVLLPGLRVYPTFGNHEMFPTNLYSQRMEEFRSMNDEFIHMWYNFAKWDDNETMSNLAYYTTTVPEHPKLRIMSINTNYDWYDMNFYHTLNQHSPEYARYKEWINDTLSSARNNNERVIVLGHHPVGSGHVRASRWWEEVVVAFGDVIIMHVSGHTHQDHFKLSFDPFTMEAKSVNLMTPSVSSSSHINPSMRVFYLDPDREYQLVDFENFYLDINTQEESKGVPPAISFSYRASDEYDLSNLSPNSWKELVLRFYKDDDLYQRYYRRKSAGTRSNENCDYNCKIRDLCSIWFPEADESEECVSLAPPLPEITTPPITGEAFSLAGNCVMLIAVLCFGLAGINHP